MDGTNDYKMPMPPDDPRMITYSPQEVNQPRSEWSWSATVCSCIGLWMCCSPCAFVGLIYSMLSYSDHKVGDYEAHSSKRRCAWGCTITGIMIFVLVVGLFVVMYTIAYDWLLFHLRAMRQGVKSSIP